MKFSDCYAMTEILVNCEDEPNGGEIWLCKLLESDTEDVFQVKVYQRSKLSK